jgi:hypothetical protein
VADDVLRTLLGDEVVEVDLLDGFAELGFRFRLCRRNAAEQGLVRALLNVVLELAVLEACLGVESGAERIKRPGAEDGENAGADFDDVICDRGKIHCGIGRRGE